MAGYNTMPEEEKAGYNVDGVASVFRNAMFGMAIILIGGHYLGKWLENPQIETISLFAAICIGVPYLLIKSNSSNYRKKDQ